MVSMVEGAGRYKVVVEVVSLLGGVEILIRPNPLAVVRWNADHDYPPEGSGNTSPDIVAAAMKELREARPGEIIQVEAAAMGCDTAKCLPVHGSGTSAAGAQSVRHCGRRLKRTIERFQGNPF
jgi:uncharacterized protein (DUF362 family)